ncbi:hypothetical protein PF595_02970, partial [Lactobacillus delbrueckii]|nr:hypothetical protein [Lactobacillus delbrueckii]
YFNNALYVGTYTDYTQADSTDYTQYTWSRLKGDAGPTGATGPKGADGQTTYVHFAYANSADGKTDFNVSYFNNALYVGTYTDYTQADSTDYTQYTWSRLKGDAGPTGATGPKGDTGDTGFFIGTTPPPNPSKGTVWATNDASGNMVSAHTWDGSNWVSTAFTQDLVAGNITATKIVGGELDVNKVTIKNAQNIPITSTVSLGDKLSNIEQNANGISTTVRNLHAGDRNLARGIASSKDWFDFQGFNGGTNYCYDLVSYSLDALKAGDKVTFGITMKNEGVTSGTIFFQQYGNVSEWTRDNFTVSNWGTSVTDLVPNGTEKALTYTITVTDGMLNGNTSYIIRVRTDNVPAGGKLSFRYAFVKKGTLATDWTPAPEDVDDSISQVKQTADGISAYVKGSRGSSTLSAILSMDPNNSTIGQVVNGHVVAAINMSSDGDLKIVGNKLHITADTKIENATIKSAMIDSIDASKITTGELNADKVTITHLTADKIESGTLNGITITGSRFVANTDNGNLFGKLWDKYQVVVENAGIDITGNYTIGNQETQVITTITGGDLYTERITNTLGSDSDNWTKSIDINTDGPNPYIKLVNSGPEPGKYESTYIGTGNIYSQRVKADDGHFAQFRFIGNDIRTQNNLPISITNSNGKNFDNTGAVGLQVYAGLGLGKRTIYVPGDDIFVQSGNCWENINTPYSKAGKVKIHCKKIMSEEANTVSSRLSVKTDITKVSYDRALAAVEGTEMYDYRYVSDDSGQHYVSGIIDDVNADPQYHMDGMLINKERTARIDANLVGYHHVVIQKLLDRVAALEEKVK